MPIPESQLVTWSNQGAQQGSANTYASIKAALAKHTWPCGMDHHVYLQGSYPNATNIRGDSDVDIVIESSNVFYHDVPQEYRNQLGFGGGAWYSWTDFRDQVKTALTNHYGFGTVTQADKCIKIKGNGSNQLDADVVPCSTYKHYNNTTHIASGITFWTPAYQQIVNYPKLHLTNGQAKNASCSMNYKPTVRIFKNARNRAQSETLGRYPSYFLECLLYNAPTSYFVNSRSATFREVLEWLRVESETTRFDFFQCQNGYQYMFGTGLHQSNSSDAKRLIADLVRLWNEWS